MEWNQLRPDFKSDREAMDGEDNDIRDHLGVRIADPKMATPMSIHSDG
jgi:hypothetical protein